MHGHQQAHSDRFGRGPTAPRRQPMVRSAALGAAAVRCDTLARADVVALQRAIGNQAVTSMLQKGSITVQRAPWYQPWLIDYEYSPTTLLQKSIVDHDTLSDFDTGWSRDAVGTGLLSAAAGVATTLIAKRLKLKQLLAIAFGAGSAFARGFEGYGVQERFFGQTVELQPWYGRYRMNILSREFEAVDFRGLGSRTRSFVSPHYYQQRIVNAAGDVVYTHWRASRTYPGVPIDRHRKEPPQQSFGSFE